MGKSDRAHRYERAEYVADVAAFHRHLGVGPVPVLGHSLGGVNAYQFAARHADKVSALIVEDIGAVVDCDWSFTTRLPGVAPSREALARPWGRRRPIWSVPSVGQTRAGASPSASLTPWRPRRHSTVITGRTGYR
ncbi:alpha/beta fold hydrolase [Streptomyces netropsis]